MSPWEGIVSGLYVVMKPEILVFCFFGVLIGTLVGVLPGLGPVGAIALLLPMTFGQDFIVAIIMLSGIYYGAMYGGSTTSILINVPGEATSVATCIDGYQMALKGRAGPALAIAAIGSFIAGTIGIFFLMMVAPALARFALRFGPPEYFALAFLGLLTLSRLTGKSPLKSYTVMLLGMAIATVGIDSVSGFARFTGGSSALLEGIDFIPVIMGLYGIGEVFASVKKIGVSPRITLFRTRDLIPTRKDIKDSVGPILRGGLMGFFLGLIPGPSAIISTFGSYTLERKLSKRPEEFGKGAIEGVAGPEAANNGASSGAFVPLLSLGIPFSPVPAVLLAAFMIHGILPGPLLIRDHPNIFWGLIASMYVGNIMLLVLNLPLVGIFARVALIPNRIIMPTIIAFCFIGAFAVRNSIYDLFLLLIFGIIGFFFRLQDYDPAPLVLGMIIGPMLEEAFRESMVIFGGDVFQFFLRPLSGVMIGISIFVIISLFLSQFIKIFGIVFQRIDKRKAS